MEELRYSRDFKQSLITLLSCVLLFGTVIAFVVASIVQYYDLVSGMETVQARIVDIDWDIHRKGPDEQELYIIYKVDGVTYSGELRTDTTISFSAGLGAHYSVGDTVRIFYDPQDPEIIASPRSVGTGVFYLVIGLSGLALVGFSLLFMLKHHRKFLVTQEAYEEEKAEQKRLKLARKAQKKKEKEQRKAETSLKRQIVKIILIILAVPVGVYAFLLLLGGLQAAFGT